MKIVKIYYTLKPIIPRHIQILLRRHIVLRTRLSFSDVWPIDPRAGERPQLWVQWPNQKRFALVLTHDVETEKGHENCERLMELEIELGYRSSFNFVPERYDVSSELRHCLIRNGFEVGVHGLKHDGKLYSSQKIFRARAVRINQYLREWSAVGFRSPSMHNNKDWLCELDIEYDASTFDTDPFEPQSTGVHTILPFWVQGDSDQKGYVELPYTLPQDFTLFVLMKEQNIDIWKRKLDWIVEKGGMALINTHPDNMKFGSQKPAFDGYPVAYYERFLQYLKEKYKDQFWHVLPRDIARFWFENALGNRYQRDYTLTAERPGVTGRRK